MALHFFNNTFNHVVGLFNIAGRCCTISDQFGYKNRYFDFNTQLFDPTKQQKLVNILQSIAKRYNSIFFSKLVLFDLEELEDQGRVRHYDIECEAATSIVSVLDTKIKAINLKFLHELKSFVHEKNNPQHASCRSVSKSAGKKCFSTSSRHAASTAHVRKYANENQYSRVSFQPVVNDKSNRESLDQIDYSIQALMQKVRNLNQRIQKKSRVQIAKTQHEFTPKLEKRRQILSKLNRLQNQLETYMEEQNKPTYSYTTMTSRLRKSPSGEDLYKRHCNSNKINTSKVSYYTTSEDSYYNRW